MRLINADELPEHKFTRESAKSSDYIRGWNDAIDTIVDNAPTAEITEEQAIDKLHDTDWLPLHDKEMTKRPTGE